ncbi:hypothetical protein GCM10011613_13140 [Cellvibrio zantedeschiae]|uniref:AsmA domain-containing protein n=1 Tax=Cellvibrio zantedeschiae TaxID=1237077 RepID=A0ABQ3B0M8_9GAMM|nr:AsmA family protein [Cellvibrio zantedeschiae]GGY70109.1 hypothetical protein GCM10011613_13140 [Cellvibrio zantedeschiae]
MFSKSVRHHKLLTVIGVFISVLLIAVLVLILFSEPIIKSLVQGKGSEKLGRQLVIEGAFDIDWHWGYTQVKAEKIRLSNAPGYPEKNMMTIEGLYFSFKTLNILKGSLEFGDVVFNKPFLVLDRKTATEYNWNFPVFSDAKVLDETVLPDNRYEFPAFQTLELKAGQFIYRDAVKGMNLDLKLDSVNGQDDKENDKNKRDSKQLAADKAFRIAGSGSMQKQKFLVEASGGSLDSLRDSSKDYPLKLQITMGATKVLVDGAFKDPVKLAGVNASLDIRGSNMADLFYLTAIPLPITPPYVLEGRLTKSGNVWAYEGFKGKVGGSDLAGNLSYDLGSKRGFLKANLASNLMDSKDLGGFIGLSPSGENATPEQKKAAAEKKASPKLIPDVPLKLERLRGTDLDVTLKAEKIVAPGIPFKGMEVRFYLKNGLLDLDPFKVVLADGTVDGKIEIDANKDVPPMKMNLGLHKLSLGQFFANTRFAKTTEGVFGGKLNLAGTGSSLADVLATSNGEFTIIMSGGKISQLLIEASDLDIAQALPLFLGKDNSTRIRCGVTDFDVKDGLLTSKVVVLDTNDSLLTGKVSINMKKETISARLDAKPKDSSIFSAQIPITLSGQLKSPAVGLDGKKVGSKGTAAAILSGILAPFAAILPFIEIGDAENADCRALITNARR